MDASGPPAMTPPSSPPPPRRPADQATWPIVLGILAIVFGFTGLVGGACGVYTLVRPETMTALNPASQAALQSQVEVFERARPWKRIEVSGGLALSAMLLAAGIGWIARQTWSLPVGVAWAVASLLWTPVVMYRNYQFHSESLGALKSQNPGMFLPPGAFVVAAMVGGLLVAWAFPTLVLIWLGRPAIRREIAGWGLRPPR